ncbi:N-alpha-acyl-glutamine aminoacylase [Mycolicibacterium mageritense DSM 44476 = CIP 104973]|uniref:Hippurate hydrolase n=1 Tax=Mycolicibacterium mageritense TaxID=53462 RepID=A0AAI8TXZ5_MYCME|nr:amidohydrolase [Mycolicibacterium mageritense]MCC9185514.1 amidohydrolase [Mycolicibacterium mageritense]BBX36145.1 peptidase [Mycolicibacterium mageritense]BDY30975.1 Hippurate hydrolase [Mycolicibacterium mageritense]CDO24262.1 N-alpha-acyl-glutamine aminoacylase [Mycolicibacterium mageritense DSM 44476 = CIP 104973]
MTGSRADAILAALPEVRAWQEPLYRDLHQHPELSHHEQRTAGVIASRLAAAGLQVHDGIGGTGVVGMLRNGAGPTVLLRADIDALPVTEVTGLPYASTEPGVMHACGHDVHVTCLLGAAELFARATEHWNGTVVALFQPAEEVGGGARGMVDDGLADVVGRVDVAMAQHVMPAPAGHLGTRSGPVLSAADSMRVTVYGRGGHGSMPHATVDPVVLAAMIVIRLQTIVSREVAPTETVVLTVGSIHAGTKSNVIGDHAVLELNLRTYDQAVRAAVLDAIRRVVIAECQASDSPREPEFELYDSFPLTVNDADVTARVDAAFRGYFGDRVQAMGAHAASEDFSDIPVALGVPYTYWGLGGIDEQTYRAAAAADRVSADIPVNHSPRFAPVIQPTLDTGTQALVVAALSWL